ncbi:MAG: hypothetical protein HYX65_03005 [Gemmatimonadetes bacterium]|nr:hypothetical protein [Gemmatimonadota bacterium]
MLLPFFTWCEATWLGQLVRDSLWLFPVIEAVHLLGLCLLGGALLVVDLRLLGLGLRQQPIAVVARGARPWLVGSVVLMLATGTLLFLSEAVKCYHNPSFWVKITTLPVALVFTFAVRQRLAARDTFRTGWRSRLLATASLALWFTVAAAGRWIGFSS